MEPREDTGSLPDDARRRADDEWPGPDDEWVRADDEEPGEDAELRRFWADAKVRARLSPADGYFGRSANDTVLPSAWSYGTHPVEADRFVEQVLAGEETELSSPRSDHGDELPERGTMSILLDGAGQPRALLVTTDVTEKDDGATVVETFELLVPKPPRRRRA